MEIISQGWLEIFYLFTILAHAAGCGQHSLQFQRVARSSKYRACQKVRTSLRKWSRRIGRACRLEWGAPTQARLPRSIQRTLRNPCLSSLGSYWACLSPCQALFWEREAHRRSSRRSQWFGTQLQRAQSFGRAGWPPDSPTVAWRSLFCRWSATTGQSRLTKKKRKIISCLPLLTETMAVVIRSTESSDPLALSCFSFKPSISTKEVSRSDWDGLPGYTYFTSLSLSSKLSPPPSCS